MPRTAAGRAGTAALFALGSIALAACKTDAPAGATGATGAMGAAGEGGAPAASVAASVAASGAAAAHDPTVRLITSKDHRHVIKLDVGDSFEIPQDSTYDYKPELKEPDVFRADSAAHFTAIKSGQSGLLVDAYPICREADARACGRSRERWAVELIVR